MGSIQLLNDEVINKIAAGEVVERPSSVVKELVENAIDAGASRIEVRLELGGTSVISVSDDGYGMDRADAGVALQRHATSKIKETDDLFQIQTMGFRGEALASIASVSKFTLCTIQDGSAIGTKVTAQGGAEVVVRDWNGPRGTTITVESLFYNVPVRAKFLKSPATEFAQCLELMHSISLCHPGIGFTLFHNNKEHFSVPAITPLGKGSIGEEALTVRARAVIGKDAAALIYVQDENRYGRIEALVSPPGVEKNSGKHMHLFVNGRWVKDKTIRYGVMRGYHTHLLKGRYPVAVIHMQMDPTLVDVNVHPAKTELRFQYPADVQSLLAQAIRKALRNPVWVAATGANLPAGGTDTVGAAEAGTIPGYRSGASTGTRQAESFPARYSGTTTSIQSFRSNYRAEAGSQAIGEVSGSEDIDRLLHSHPPSFSVDCATDEVGTIDREVIPWNELDYVGCFADCYLLFSDQNRMLAVDQHAFHERILYERLKNDRALLGQRQRLLVPEVVQLAPSQVAYLKSQLTELIKQGFELEFVGEDCVVVKAVASILAGKDLVALVNELAVDPSEPDIAEYANRLDASDLTLATIACHSAVRAGEKLSDDDLQLLIREAGKVDFYHNCPHGRRVFRWWNKSQVARWFDR